MIPIKLISKKQASKIGFAKRKEIIMGIMERGGDGKPDRILEKQIIENNKKALIFMSEEREQELKKQRQFTKYIKQFNKIPRGLK